MREAAEAGDDILVVLGPAVVGFAFHPGLKQPDLEILVGAILRMLEGQVEEPADVALDLQVLSGLKRVPRDGPRQRIGGEGMARAPEGIPRKLVQQDQQGQRALGRVRPGIQLPPRGGKVRRLELFAEEGVENPVPGEPL